MQWCNVFKRIPKAHIACTSSLYYRHQTKIKVSISTISSNSETIKTSLLY